MYVANLWVSFVLTVYFGVWHLLPGNDNSPGRVLGVLLLLRSMLRCIWLRSGLLLPIFHYPGN